MTVLAHNQAFDGGSTQMFTCATGMGTSQASRRAPTTSTSSCRGTFGVARDGAGADDVEITADQNTRSTPLTFQVEATGGARAQARDRQGGGNCACRERGGTGIDGHDHADPQQRRRVRAADVHDRRRRDQAGGTYTIDCATPGRRAPASRRISASPRPASRRTATRSTSTARSAAQRAAGRTTTRSGAAARQDPDADAEPRVRQTPTPAAL